VIGGGVGPGVARAQQRRDRLAGAAGTVVEIGQQRMVPERLLERMRRALLGRMGADQGGVRVEDQQEVSDGLCT